MLRKFVRCLSVGAVVSLSACLGSSGSAPTTAPILTVTKAGDESVLLSWNQTPDPTDKYFLYYKVGASVQIRELDAATLVGVQSPLLVQGLANGSQYAFVMNFTHDGSPAGPTSNMVTATPRLIGPTGWTATTGPTAQNLNSIAFDTAEVCAVGNAGTILVAPYSYAANNGTPAWAAPTTPPPTAVTANLTSVVFDTARFIALGADGTIVYSSDGYGTTWLNTTPTYTGGLNGATLNSLAYLGGRYVAVGTGGNIWSSTALATAAPVWTKAAGIPVVDFNAVRVVNGGFFALGQNGTIMSSADGVNWIQQIVNPATANALRSVAYGAANGGTPYYVAVGDAGTVVSIPGANFTSFATAATWTPQATSAGQIGAVNLYDIVHGWDFQFMAVGTGGVVAYSGTGADGSWTTGNSAVTQTSANLTSLLTVQPAYYAVGSGGTTVVGQ